MVLSSANKAAIENLLDSAEACMANEQYYSTMLTLVFDISTFLKRMFAIATKLLFLPLAAGVSSHCRNSSSEYGYSTGQPCVYIRISRVRGQRAGRPAGVYIYTRPHTFRCSSGHLTSSTPPWPTPPPCPWLVPECHQARYSMHVQECTCDTAKHCRHFHNNYYVCSHLHTMHTRMHSHHTKGITLFEEQAGIPLNLTNSNSRSFPFRGQPNYTYVTVILVV